jgi:hypothetical protein
VKPPIHAISSTTNNIVQMLILCLAFYMLSSKLEMLLRGVESSLVSNLAMDIFQGTQEMRHEYLTFMLYVGSEKAVTEATADSMHRARPANKI